MSDIVVIGSANMDLVVNQERLPKPGETMFGTGFDTVPGGKGLNQAVAAARAGGDVAFLGAVGDDAFGAQLRQTLEAAGIGTDGLVVVKEEPTGIAAISVVDGGENSIVVVSGANTVHTTLDDDARAAIGGARFLVAQFERSIELVTEAFRYAKDHGVTTVLTPAPVVKVGPELLGLVDILVPNAGEAEELSGAEDPVEAARSLSHQVGAVVMTRGGDGVLLAENGDIALELPARAVQPVDTTAAGDTFVGVMVACLAKGQSLQDALQPATVAASIAVTRPGASTSMPSWDEIAAAAV